MSNPFYRIRSGFQVAGTLSADPSTGLPGEIYFNTASNTFKYYNGTAWVNIIALSGTTNHAPVAWNSTAQSYQEVPTLSLSANAYGNQAGADLSVSSTQALNLTAQAGNITATAQGAGNSVTISAADSSTGAPGNITLTPGESSSSQGRVKITDGRLFGLPVYTSDPPIAIAGDFIFNSTEDSIKFFDGSVWIKPGASGNLVKSDYVDPYATSLPTGASYTVDGAAISNGNTVLFTNITGIGNNQIFMVQGVGTAMTWTAQPLFSGVIAPESGDIVLIRSGASYDGQEGIFDGTNWSFNAKIRSFNGGDYTETSGPYTTQLVDNSSNSVFSVNWQNSEHMILNYMIRRGSGSETGVMTITTDGVNAQVDTHSTYIGDTGIAFSATVSGAVLTLSYTASSMGANATMKFSIFRMSEGVGGPGGVPNYTALGGSTASAAGSASEIQFRGTSGALDADSRLQWDISEGSLNMNGREISSLSSPITLTDATTNGTVFTYPSTYTAAVIEYSVNRGTDARTGRILLASTGTVVEINDDYIETNSLGIMFSAVIGGGVVTLQYTTMATGSDATMKYSITKWN